MFTIRESRMFLQHVLPWILPVLQPLLDIQAMESLSRATYVEHTIN